MFRQIWQWLFHKRGPTYFDFSVENGEVTLLVMRDKVVRTYKSRDPVAVMIAEHALAEQPEQWGVSPLMAPLNGYNVYGDLTPTNWDNLNERVLPLPPVIYQYSNPVDDRCSWIKDAMRRRENDYVYPGGYTREDAKQAKQDFEDLYGKENIFPIPIKPADWQIDETVRYDPFYQRLGEPYEPRRTKLRVFDPNLDEDQNP